MYSLTSGEVIFLVKHRCTTRGFTEQRMSENDLEQILSKELLTCILRQISGNDIIILYGEVI
jgi:hypothetical protein